MKGREGARERRPNGVVMIKEVMGNFDTEPVAKACHCFRTRIEVVVEENRDFFK